MFRWILMFLPFCLMQGANAQVVRGKVHSDSEPVPFADVVLIGTTSGTATSDDGRFELEVNDLRQVRELRISSIGFQPKTVKLPISSDDIDLGSIELEEDMLGLNEVVITGTMRETFVKASPIKVDVVSVKHLTKNLPATNLIDGLQLVTGVQEVVACATQTVSVSMDCQVHIPRC